MHDGNNKYLKGTIHTKGAGFRARDYVDILSAGFSGPSKLRRVHLIK